MPAMSQDTESLFSKSWKSARLVGRLPGCQTLPAGCARHGFDAGVEVATDLVLPEPKHGPAVLFEQVGDPGIVAAVHVDLSAPRVGNPTGGKPMQTVAVDENGQAAGRERHVGRAWNLLLIDVGPETAPVESTAQSDFRPGTTHDSMETRANCAVERYLVGAKG